MRHPLALLTLVLAALAGCATPDEPPATTTPPAATPEPAPTPEPTPATPTPTAPPAREAKTVYNGTHDFAGAPSAPNAPPKRENFTVDADHATLRVRIALTTASPAGDISLSAGAVVRVLDPTGAVLVECSAKDDPDCAKDLAAPVAGAWSVEYAGSGTAKATVSITQVP